MFCSCCGGEQDAEGWCANYCMSDDVPGNGVGYDPYTGKSRPLPTS